MQRDSSPLMRFCEDSIIANVQVASCKGARG